MVKSPYLETQKDIGRRAKQKRSLAKPNDDRYKRYEVVAFYGTLYVRTYQTKFVHFDKAKTFAERVIKSRNNVYTDVIIWGYLPGGAQEKVSRKTATQAKQRHAHETANRMLDRGYKFRPADELGLEVQKKRKGV